MFRDYNEFLLNESRRDQQKKCRISDDKKVPIKCEPIYQTQFNLCENGVLSTKRANSSSTQTSGVTCLSSIDSSFGQSQPSSSELAQLVQKQLDESITLLKDIQGNVTTLDSTNQLNVDALQFELNAAQKSIAEYQAKNDGLMAQLKLITSDRVLEKIISQEDLTKAKEVHSQETAAMNQIHEFIYKQAVIVQTQEKEELQAKHRETMKNLERDHRRECDEIRKKYKKMIVVERERAHSDAKKWRTEQSKKIKRLEDKIKATTKEKEEMKAQMESKHKTIIKRIAKCKECGLVVLNKNGFCNFKCEKQW